MVKKGDSSNYDVQDRLKGETQRQADLVRMWYDDPTKGGILPIRMERWI